LISVSARTLTRFFTALVAASIASFHNTPVLAGQGDAYRMLNEMNRALAEINYDGIYVSLEGSALEATRVRHRKRAGRDWQQLMSLNGPEHEVIRAGQVVSTIRHLNGRLTMTQRAALQRKEPLTTIDPGQMEGWYDVVLGKQERVAGRMGQVLLIRPKDSLRYGYRLVIDKAVGLPLDIKLFRPDGDLVSQLMFVELDVSADASAGETDDDVPIERERPTANSGLQGQRLTSLSLLDALGIDAASIGFVPEVYQPRMRGETEGHVEHIMLSDGLARVSVYVEPLGNSPPFVGMTSVGSVNILGIKLREHQVTMIGEVPTETLEHLIAGAHAASAGTR
jgi:sigma-E factor negative regulatory protein RseB